MTTPQNCKHCDDGWCLDCITELRQQLEDAILETSIEPGYATEVEYIRAVDGDTYEFEIRRRFNIRLRDYDAPSKYTPAGAKAMEKVDNILEKADNIIIFIPTNNPIKLMDMNSFERLVGDVEVDGKDLRKTLIEKEL